MQQQSLGNQIASFFRTRSLLSGIVSANIIIGIFVLLFNVIEYLFCLDKGMAGRTWMQWFALSSDMGWTLLHPWTLVTYMFLHNGLWHLLFNMIMLYCAGTMCCQYLNSRRFGWIYFLSGIFGGLLYILLYNLFPVFQFTRGTLVGASAGVLGVFMAVAAYIPRQRVQVWPFRKDISMKALALIFLALDLLSIPKSNAGGHIAHIGGALMGFLYVWVMRQYPEWKRQLNSRPKKQRQQTKQRPKTDEQYNKQRADHQKRVDAILDKISKSGYDSLTKEEKQILFTYK